MKRTIISAITTVAVTLSVMAQVEVPGAPEENGLMPRTDTIYANFPPDQVNNGSTESLGVAIANNGNVIVGWEDDGTDILDLESVWTLFDGNGNSITPATEVSAGGETIATKFLAYFRPDGSAVAGTTSWGPKIKANLFGDGIGMGATSFALGPEIPEFADIQIQAGGGPGDFPTVQLLTNAGAPVATLSGLSADDAFPQGDVRIADWGYLANGNIVIVGESRQEQDLVDRFGGAAPGKHAVFRILDPTGAEVKALTLVSETTDANSIWHGVGVTANGFAVRFDQGGATVRLFDNDGNPASGNINLADLTGEPATGGGGRGDGAGFHGNANDAYVIVNSGAGPEGNPQPFVSVLNADGTLRYSRLAPDDFPFSNSGRVDAAIDRAGRVIVVFADNDVTSGDFRLVQARLFEANGDPIGGTFFVGEKETDLTAIGEARRPRVAWRGNTVAIVWQSSNSDASERVVALRLFTIEEIGGGETTLSISLNGSELTLSWEGNGALETASTVAGTFEAVTGASSPYTTQVTGSEAYFRVR